MASFVLAIDQGTTGSTVALVDHRGQLLARVNYEFPQIYPQPGWVEHRPEDIWASVQKCIRTIMRKKLCKPTDIVAIGITNQRETSLLWDRDSGNALHNAIVWQCRRTTDFCEALKAKGLEAKIKRKTGLVLDPYFSASKLRWLLNNASRARALATWRDQEAEKRNLARGFVIKDADLLTIAKRQPASLGALSELDIWHPKAIQRHGHALISIMTQVIEQGLTAEPLETLKPEHRKLIADMRKLVMEKSTELSVEPALLASRRELEGLILTPADEPIPERFMGWRSNIITTDLLVLKAAFL